MKDQKTFGEWLKEQNDKSWSQLDCPPRMPFPPKKPPKKETPSK